MHDARAVEETVQVGHLGGQCVDRARVGDVEDDVLDGRLNCGCVLGLLDEIVRARILVAELVLRPVAEATL